LRFTFTEAFRGCFPGNSGDRFPVPSPPNRVGQPQETEVTNRGRLLTLIFVLAFAGFLLWSTLSSQRVECTVTVAFNNTQNTATASGASEADATREAQTAACGPIAHGMNESIACSRIPPVSRQCRTL
jgi:hypothetical protein